MVADDPSCEPEGRGPTTWVRAEDLDDAGAVVHFLTTRWLLGFLFGAMAGLVAAGLTLDALSEKALPLAWALGALMAIAGMLIGWGVALASTCRAGIGCRLATHVERAQWLPETARQPVEKALLAWLRVHRASAAGDALAELRTVVYEAVVQLLECADCTRYATGEPLERALERTRRGAEMIASAAEVAETGNTAAASELIAQLRSEVGPGGSDGDS